MLTDEPKHQDIRDANHRSLLLAAEQVFLERGIAAATMRDIAQQSGLSRVTLYKHFRNKDELIFAIEIRILREMHQHAEHHTPDTGLAIDRLRQKLSGLSGFFFEHKHHFRFVGMFDQYYSHSYPDEGLAAEYHTVLSSLDTTEELLREGIRDGSMRADIDPHETSLFIGNVFIATAHRIAAREDILTAEQNFNMNRIIEIFCTMVLQSLQNKE